MDDKEAYKKLKDELISRGLSPEDSQELINEMVIIEIQRLQAEYDRNTFEPGEIPKIAIRILAKRGI